LFRVSHGSPPKLNSSHRMHGLWVWRGLKSMEGASTCINWYEETPGNLDRAAFAEKNWPKGVGHAAAEGPVRPIRIGFWAFPVVARGCSLAAGRASPATADAAGGTPGQRGDAGTDCGQPVGQGFLR